MYICTGQDKKLKKAYPDCNILRSRSSNFIEREENMDYKYIEQLLEHYWECKTTIQEEHILRAFFSQDDIPESLARYREVFTTVSDMAGEHLGEDFDKRILSMTTETEKQVTARRITLYHRMRPLYRAAAMVAVVLTIGMAAHHSFTVGSQEPAKMWAQESAEDPDSEFTQMPSSMENSSAKASETGQDSLSHHPVK